MLENKPLVSIYVLTYNSSKTVLETLDSIKELTYPHLELVVSDDASKDDTVLICATWIKKNRERFENVVHLTVPKNTGISENFHRAVSACNGVWFKGIAGDDALYSDSIEKLIEFAELHPQARMIQGNAALFDSNLTNDCLIRVNKSKDQNVHKVSTAKQQFDIILCWACIDAPAVFYHRSVFEIPELQHCGYAGLEDYPRFFRYTELGHLIYHCDVLVCKYRQSATSVQRTGNYNNLITRCYLKFFFDETHNYFHGLDKMARYGVNIYDWIQCYTKNIVVRKMLRIMLYPAYWLSFKLKLHYDYKRINKALAQESCKE